MHILSLFWYLFKLLLCKIFLYFDYSLLFYLDLNPNYFHWNSNNFVIHYFYFDSYSNMNNSYSKLIITIIDSWIFIEIIFIHTMIIILILILIILLYFYRCHTFILLNVFKTIPLFIIHNNENNNNKNILRRFIQYIWIHLQIIIWNVHFITYFVLFWLSILFILIFTYFIWFDIILNQSFLFPIVNPFIIM